MASTRSRAGRLFLNVIAAVAVLEASTGGNVWVEAQAQEATTTSASACQEATASLLSEHTAARDASTDFVQEFGQSCALGDILSSESSNSNSNSNNADVCGFNNQFGKSSVTANACAMTDYETLRATLQETCQDPSTGGMYCTMSVSLTGALPLALFGSLFPISQALVGSFECLAMCVSKEKCQDQDSQEDLNKLALEAFINDYGSALVGVDLSKFDMTPTMDCIYIDAVAVTDDADDTPVVVVDPPPDNDTVNETAIAIETADEDEDAPSFFDNVTSFFDNEGENDNPFDVLLDRINNTSTESEAAVLDFLSSAGSRAKPAYPVTATVLPVVALILISRFSHLFM
jgi:hypothetical protein